jgi:hypothetical protein
MIKSEVRKTANISISAKSWAEVRYDEPDGRPALAQADFTLSYNGDLVGESSVRMLVAYTGGDAADPATLVGDYVAFERVTGTLDGRVGSFVLEERGRHEGGVARTTGRVVPDSATGALAGLLGEIEYAAGAMSFEATLSYAFAVDDAVH